MRFGIGYDIHKLVVDRKLILGGVEIPSEKGLLGHSDADALCHAIIDAILGAAALGDIGKHFPDTDAKYKNISSILLLKSVSDLLRSHNFEINNVDTTIVLQKPKIAAYIDMMRKNLAVAMSVPINCISVKATTSEGLGFIGREEGAAVHAIASIKELK